ncbi:subtilisin-like protease 4 [Zingiber officinale]|uniref:subtilisin-like protease 4 n=1 Tax=Zingiber officinale TaxID=94328 RepID=UPI001C4C3AED|nr:subtilisin-like protease 4 [Zingiber officinale]
MDNEFLATIKLDNSNEFHGENIYQPQGFSSKKYPFMFLGGASTLCLNGSLNDIDMKGKIVLYDHGINERIKKGEIVKQADGAGIVLINAPKDGYSIIADHHALPALHIPYAFRPKIKAYINSSTSSQRPPSSSKAPLPMCPTLRIATLIKKVHPDWSPTTIKSTIMMTTYVKDNTNKPISNERNLPTDLIAVGANHVMPLNVLDPELIYDISPMDYYPYYAAFVYNVSDVRFIIHQKINCSSIKSIPEGELNYLSTIARLSANKARAVTFTRTVANIGEVAETYYAKLGVPEWFLHM